MVDAPARQIHLRLLQLMGDDEEKGIPRGAPRLREALVEEFGDVLEVPSLRTISRRLEEWKLKSEEEKADYRTFRWPQSMENGRLPWEASTAALEFLRDSGSSQRPSVGMVKWFWRVTLVIPDASFLRRLMIAGHIAVVESYNPTELPRDEAESVEAILVYRPWESEEAWHRYETACNKTGTEVRGGLETEPGFVFARNRPPRGRPLYGTEGIAWRLAAADRMSNLASGWPSKKKPARR